MKLIGWVGIFVGEMQQKEIAQFGREPQRRGRLYEVVEIRNGFFVEMGITRQLYFAPFAGNLAWQVFCGCICVVVHSLVWKNSIARLGAAQQTCGLSLEPFGLPTPPGKVIWLVK